MLVKLLQIKILMTWCVKKPIGRTVYNTANDDTEIVHLNRKSADECALKILIGNRHHKALWESGAGKCVISFDCYRSIPTKYKTELYPSRIKIKAASGIFITNKGECDLAFVIDDEKFTFPSSAQINYPNKLVWVTILPKHSI